MKNCHIESIIYGAAQGIKKLMEQGIISKDKKIVLYGLDTYSFAMRTILANLGFQVDSYISDNPELLMKYKRTVKSIKARYLNSSRDLIGIYSITERLQPFDEDILIISASENCPVMKMEELSYKKNVSFFQVYDWQQDDFAEAMRGKCKMTVPEIQNTEKDMLYQIDRFCRDRDLRYWVCGGTLLGTVRHKGFIPWDDDVDIFMPWQDYRRFMKEFADNGRYGIIAPDITDRKDYYDLFIKILDSHTIVKEELGLFRKIHPVSLDVFPLIGMPLNEEERHRFFMEYTELEKMIWEDFYANNGDLWVYNKWYPAQKEFLEKYDFDDSDYVGVLATAYGERDCTTRQVYKGTIRMPFEDIEVNVPAGYREYLDNLYGEDWMELPDESKRVSHHNMEAYRL